MINNMGIALLPTFIVGDEIKNKQATVVLSDWQLPATNISLLYPSNKHLSAKVRAFVDMAVMYFRNF